MSWKPRNYTKNLELLKKRSHELHRKMEDGSFYELSYFARYREVRKIKQLYNRLMGPLSEGAIKQAVSFASVLMLITGAGCDSSSDDGTASVTLQLQIGKASGTAVLSQAALTKSAAPSTVTGITVTVTGKNMAPIVKEISTESSSTGLVVPAGPDRRFYVQADTIYEGFICGTVVRDIPPNKSIVLPIRMEGCGMPELQLNTTDNPLSGISFGSSDPVYPSFGDLDNDGDLDLLISSGDTGFGSNVSYYRNDSGSFTSAPDPTGLGDSHKYRKFVDIDKDGDLDVSYSSYEGGSDPFAIGVYSNISSVFDTPIVVASIPYNGNPRIMDFGDLDNDGDYDIVIGATGSNIISSVLEFRENTGSLDFSTQIPVSIGVGYNFRYALSPVLVDIDNDGDLDLVIGQGFYNTGTSSPEGRTLLFSNTGNEENHVFSDPPDIDPFGIDSDLTSTIHVYPAFADLDEDGDLDLFVGTYNGTILYFENIIIP